MHKKKDKTAPILIGAGIAVATGLYFLLRKKEEVPPTDFDVKIGEMVEG